MIHSFGKPERGKTARNGASYWAQALSGSERCSVYALDFLAKVKQENEGNCSDEDSGKTTHFPSSLTNFNTHSAD
ncbi:hypothetical protein LINPERPRIM_LOCUS40176 [Linum perenne]